MYLDDYCYKAFHNLTRARYFAVQNLVKEKQRFLNCLFKFYFHAVEGIFRLLQRHSPGCVQSMRALDTQIKNYAKAIAAQMELIPNPLTSISGIGSVYSASIIAEIGDINRLLN